MTEALLSLAALAAAIFPIWQSERRWQYDAFERRHAIQTKRNQISDRERRQLRERDHALTFSNLSDRS